MKILNISNNLIPSIPTVFYTSFPNVSDLDISFNTIKELSMGILMMKKLKILDLTGNLIQALPTYLKFVKLDRLYIEWGPYSEYEFVEAPKVPVQARGRTRSGRKGSFAFKSLFDKRTKPIDLKAFEKAVEIQEANKQKKVHFYDYVKLAKKDQDFETINKIHTLTKLAIFR